MNSAAQRPVVVASGHTMALAVARALGEADVPVVLAHYDAHDFAHASRYVVSDVRTPDPRSDEAGFIDALGACGERFPGSLLIPASDESVVAIARHKESLARWFVVACPDWEVCERFIDKTLTYSLAEASGVPVPRTLTPRSASDLAEGVHVLGFPMLLKPAESHRFFERFGKKMVRVESVASLESDYQLAVDAGLDVMLQEIIPGTDSAVVNYNAYVSDGQALVEFTARQLRKVPPELGSPRVAVSEHISEVIGPGRQILAALGFHGFACVEFKLDARDGVYKLMEVNGRYNLSGLLATRCGINFPLLHYRHLMEGEPPMGRAFRSGVYWTDVLRDLVYSILYLQRERHSPASYLAPYARRHCDAILDGHDMGPFWARLRDLASSARVSAGAARRR